MRPHGIVVPSGMLASLRHMAGRLEPAQPNPEVAGWVRLHCDPTVGHSLKLVMDEIFREAASGTRPKGASRLG